MEYSIQPLGESALVIYFDDKISDTVIEKITVLNHAIRKNPFNGFTGSVPAYVSLTIYYDPFVVTRSGDQSDLSAFQQVCNWLHNLKTGFDDLSSKKEMLIPVCFDAEYAPDLQELADFARINADDVIRLFTEASFRVYMLGFMPGFPYLGGLPDELAMPRKATPRALVPAGAVGIAGRQAGIYPLDSPGGWQIIGRTPVVLFDPEQKDPALVKPGTRIKFSPITRSDFDMLSR